MKILVSRGVVDATIRVDCRVGDPRPHLVVEGEAVGPGWAAGYELVEATDIERQALRLAGYYLPPALRAVVGLVHDPVTGKRTKALVALGAARSWEEAWAVLAESGYRLATGAYELVPGDLVDEPVEAYGLPVLPPSTRPPGGVLAGLASILRCGVDDDEQDAELGHYRLALAV